MRLSLTALALIVSLPFSVNAYVLTPETFKKAAAKMSIKLKDPQKLLQRALAVTPRNIPGFFDKVLIKDTVTSPTGLLAQSPYFREVRREGDKLITDVLYNRFFVIHKAFEADPNGLGIARIPHEALVGEGHSILLRLVVTLSPESDVVDAVIESCTDPLFAETVYESGFSLKKPMTLDIFNKTFPDAGKIYSDFKSVGKTNAARNPMLFIRDVIKFPLTERDTPPVEAYSEWFGPYYLIFINEESPEPFPGNACAQFSPFNGF